MKLAEFRTYAEFGSEELEELRALWPSVEPQLQPIVDDFYERILSHESTAGIVRDPKQLTRLMKTLKGWLKELLCDTRDEHYAERRQRIGRAHVQVGVDHATMFMAMSAMQAQLERVAVEVREEPCAALRAIRKATMLDLALMTDSYHRIRQSQSVTEARSLLVAHLPSAALLLNQEGVVESATPASKWLTDGTEGAHYTEMLPDALIQASQLTRYLDESSTNRTDIHLPSVSVELDGEVRHLSLTLVPFENPDPGALIYIEDHTSAVEAERRARRKEHLAGIGTLSATIAHELRNPLAGISGALQVIVAGYSPDDRRKPILDKVLSEVRALNQMVTDLLTYAKPHEAQTENGVDLLVKCTGIVEGARREFPDVEFEICGEGTASIDPDMLRHIVLNLVLNACHATGGTGKVRIHIESDVVTVCDDGPGLPPDVAKRMFEPFFTTKLKGTGLGLPISAKLARTMGGALRLRNESPLGGACFELQLFKTPR